MISVTPKLQVGISGSESLLYFIAVSTGKCNMTVNKIYPKIVIVKNSYSSSYSFCDTHNPYWKKATTTTTNKCFCSEYIF